LGFKKRQATELGRREEHKINFLLRANVRSSRLIFLTHVTNQPVLFEKIFSNNTYCVQI